MFGPRGAFLEHKLKTQGGDTENTIFLSGGRSGGQNLRTLRKFVEERALSQKESWYYIKGSSSKGHTKGQGKGQGKDKGNIKAKKKAKAKTKAMKETKAGQRNGLNGKKKYGLTERKLCCVTFVANARPFGVDKPSITQVIQFGNFACYKECPCSVSS